MFEDSIEPETIVTVLPEQSFFDQARERLLNVLPQNPEVQNVGSQLMDAVYNYGAGRISTAREKVVSAFLSTGEGKKLQASAIQQTIQQYLPIIIVTIIGLLGVGFLAARR